MKKKNEKTLQISVGISCLNEEKNIRELLESILVQKQKGFILKEVYVISDGSTDDTVKKCQMVKDKRIIIIEGKKRLGKASRFNTLCQYITGDIFISLDADITVLSQDIFIHLIQPFKTDVSIALVGGNPRPHPGRTFVENAVNTTYDAYAPLRQVINDSSNPFGCDGKILALGKSFAKSVTIPKHMIGTDSYLYFLCKTKGLKFKHVPSAVVYYRSPATVRDHIQQNTRFIAAEYLHKDLFGNVVDKEYAIPKKLFYTLLFKQIVKNPVKSASIFLINRYCQFLAKKNYHSINEQWQIVQSTKG